MNFLFAKQTAGTESQPRSPVLWNWLPHRSPTAAPHLPPRELPSVSSSGNRAPKREGALQNFWAVNGSLTPYGRPNRKCDNLRRTGAPFCLCEGWNVHPPCPRRDPIAACLERRGSAGAG